MFHCGRPGTRRYLAPLTILVQAKSGAPSNRFRYVVNTLASGNETTLEQRARCRLAFTYAANSAPGDGFDLPARRQHVVQVREPLAECCRDLHIVGQTLTLAPEWYRSAAGSIWGSTPAPACASRLPPCQCRYDSAGILGAKAGDRPGADRVTGRTVPCRGRPVTGVLHRDASAA